MRERGDQRIFGGSSAPATYVSLPGNRLFPVNHPGDNSGMKAATISMLSPAKPDPSLFDLGHQGDVDRTQIAARLALSPTERLRHHEPWRMFVKEALKRAARRRKDRGSAG